MQIAPGDLVLWLFVVGGLAAFAGIFYFVWAGLKRDHATGEYDFTWGVAIVALFLMGFAPGLVGVGLYLTIDRGYPLYVLQPGPPSSASPSSSSSGGRCRSRPSKRASSP